MKDKEILDILHKVCLALRNNKVDYMVVGGAAVSYHGYARVSSITLDKPSVKVDLDFWYKPTF